MPVVPPRMQMNPPTDSKKGKCEILRYEVEQNRQTFMPHWQELSEYLRPRRGRFGQNKGGNRGDKRSQKIIDSTAIFASRTLGSGMMAGLTSPARPWFRLTVPDPELAEFEPVKVWLHDVRQRMISVFLKSNLYQILPTIYRDLGDFGTGCLMVVEDPEQIIRAYDFPIGQYGLANDEYLRTRVFVREFSMTLRQIAGRFGLDKLSEPMKTEWDKGNREVSYEVVHLIAPNDGFDATKRASEYKRFVSYYYDFTDNTPERFLEVSGFDEFPVFAPKWEASSEDVYGTDCPGMTSLGDNKQLQLGEKRGFQALEKMVNPPMVGPTALMGAKASLLPGDITYLDTREGQKGFQPVHEINMTLRDLEFKQEQARFRIRRAYFEDLFLMLASRPDLDARREITAREIEERHEEKLLALGPILEHTNQDMLDPLIDRTFNIMERRGLLPPAPPDLEGQDLKVEYISILSQAQKMVGLSGLEQFSLFVRQLAETDPSVYDKVDRDQMIDEYADMAGVAPRIVRPDEIVAETRAARAKAAQAQQEAALLKEAASGAKALSETDLSQPSLLKSLAGAMGEQEIPQ